MTDTSPLWSRLDRWLASTPKPTASAWDGLIDDLYRAQEAVYGEYVSIGDFDQRHPGEADRLFVACGRWGWL